MKAFNKIMEEFYKEGALAFKEIRKKQKEAHITECEKDSKKPKHFWSANFSGISIGSDGQIYLLYYTYFSLENHIPWKDAGKVWKKLNKKNKKIKKISALEKKLNGPVLVQDSPLGRAALSAWLKGDHSD